MKKVLPIILIIIGIILLSTPFLTEQIIKYHKNNLVSERISNEDIISNIKDMALGVIIFLFELIGNMFFF